MCFPWLEIGHLFSRSSRTLGNAAFYTSKLTAWQGNEWGLYIWLWKHCHNNTKPMDHVWQLWQCIQICAVNMLEMNLTAHHKTSHWLHKHYIFFLAVLQNSKQIKKVRPSLLLWMSISTEMFRDDLTIENHRKSCPKLHDCCRVTFHWLGKTFRRFV